MSDPLADVVGLLQPRARFSKHVHGSGPWRVARSDIGDPFYCAVLAGGCRLALDGGAPLELEAGDFVLVPATYGITMSSLAAMPGDASSVPIALGGGVFRIGEARGPDAVELSLGHCSFDSPDAALLVSLLPKWVHVRGDPRLATLVRLVSDESRSERPAREPVLARLLEVLLIEALRSGVVGADHPGLVRGLADPRLALALRAMHAEPARAWSTQALAAIAALSRSAFFERFGNAVGTPPMEYLLGWRMALAKALLRRERLTVAEVAQRVGYGSASAFSVAFARHVGQPPAAYARAAPMPA